MSATIGSTIGKQLYRLLPEVYRERDNGDLAKYLDASGELLDRVYNTLRQRLDDHFPETCQPWLLPYFADLLDVSLKSPVASGRRAEVAHAISWRQRKGTAGCVEEIAEAVGAMEVELQEGWRRIARTAAVGEKSSRRSDPPITTVDFRRASRAVQAVKEALNTHRTRFADAPTAVLWSQHNPQGVPCFPGSYEDRSMRTVDLRTPDLRRGQFHPRRLLAFVPPPPGFFASEPLTFKWSELEQATESSSFEKEEGEWLASPEMEVRHTKFYRQHANASRVEVCVRIEQSKVQGGVRQPPFSISYASPTEHAALVRIEDQVVLAQDGSVSSTVTHRFQSFHFESGIKAVAGRLELERCAVPNVETQYQESDSEPPALCAQNCLLGDLRAAGGLQLEYCTVLGTVTSKSISAVDSLFCGPLRGAKNEAATPDINRLRHVRVPRELLELLAKGPPQSKVREQLNRIQHYTTDLPVFFSKVIGARGAGVLHPTGPAAIRTGAEDGGELGAFHHQHLALREQAVRDKLAEYLPFGMEVVLIPDERLLHSPPQPK